MPVFLLLVLGMLEVLVVPKVLVVLKELVGFVGGIFDNYRIQKQNFWRQKISPFKEKKFVRQGKPNNYSFSNISVPSRLTQTHKLSKIASIL